MRFLIISLLGLHLEKVGMLLKKSRSIRPQHKESVFRHVKLNKVVKVQFQCLVRAEDDLHVFSILKIPAKRNFSHHICILTIPLQVLS